MRLSLMGRVVITRFTCPKIAVLFTGSFQVVLFFADLRRNKGLYLIESLFFLHDSAKK